MGTLKAQAWGRMVPGQIGLHLSQLREQAEKLRLPEKASPPQDARILHYHCDHLGTPQELTDEDGKLVWSASYEAWGKVRRLTGKPGPEGADPFTPSQFWHPLTQPGRSDQLPEWVADNTSNVQHWRETQKAERPAPEAVNDQNIWGELTDQSIRFQGQYYDIETGLHYNRFRYYDPVIGRFINQDPLGVVGGRNLYQYSPNPIQWIDPLGLSWAPADYRANWELAYGARPSEHQVHHIIPKDDQYEKLIKSICPGFNIHGSDNLIALPKYSTATTQSGKGFGTVLHNGSHEGYTQAVVQALRVAARFKAPGVTGCMKMKAIQDAARSLLQSGGGPISATRHPGGTVDAVKLDWQSALRNQIKGL